MPINPPVATLFELQRIEFTLTDANGAPVDARWSIAPSVGAIDPNNGTYTAPRNVSQPQEVMITATPVAGGPAETSTVTIEPIAVTVFPPTVALRARRTQQFIAKVIGDPNGAVEWAVAPTVGNMTAAGLYTAPDLITDDEILTITAISSANQTKTATVTLRLQPEPLEWRRTAGIGIFLLLVFTLVGLLVGLWPPPPADKSHLEKSTAVRIAAESTLKEKELEARRADEQTVQSSALAARAEADQAIKEQAQRDKATAEQANREKADAARELASKLAAEQREADKLLNASEAWVSTPLAELPREIDLLLLALIAGALGSFVHVSRSYIDYVGNRTLRSSWCAWYLLYPFIGAALALIFYIALRGGLLTASTDVNPYGMVAIAALVGMFTKQATDKLSEIFSILFKTEKEKELKDKLNPS